jgi:pimeloyl-ACP methyl ester carboxylesterase
MIVISLGEGRRRYRDDVPDATVRSTDGTELAVRVTGTGSPVVLVHGTTGSKDSWVFVEPLLATKHTVWAYDRRGRGESGDHAEHSLDREVDDVLAVVARAGQGDQVHLVGHSYGGCCAMEAAARSDSSLASLTVYEPPFHAVKAAQPVARALERLDADDPETALVMFLSEVAGVSDDEIAMARSVDFVWAGMVATAGTLRREAQALTARPWDANRYRSIGIATLLISGEVTQSPVYLTADDVRDAVPHADAVVLPGQGHIAIAADPQAFANAVLQFTDC